MAKTQKNSSEKEAKRLLEEKFGNMPMDSKNRLHVIADLNESIYKRS